LSLDVIDN